MLHGKYTRVEERAEAGDAFMGFCRYKQELVAICTTVIAAKSWL